MCGPNVVSIQFVPNVSWPRVLNPLMLIVYYVYMVIQYKMTKHGINRLTDRAKDDDLSSVHEEVRTATRVGALCAKRAF